MQDFPRKLARFFAIVFAVLFALSLPEATLLYNGEKYAFRAKVYKQALLEENAYETLPKILAKSLVEKSQESDEHSFAAALTEEDWEFLLNEFLPPTETRKMAEEGIDKIFLYLNGKETDTVLSLKPLKEKLNGREGVDAVLRLLATKPDCTLEDIEKIALPGSSEPVICNPPEEALPLFKPALHLKLQSIASEIPATIPLIQMSPDELLRLRNIRLMMRLSPLLPILALLLATLLAVRTLKGWLQWWGIPAFIGGILAALLGGLLPILYTAAFYTSIAPNMPEEISPLVLTATLNVLAFPAHATIVAGGIFAITGGALWAISAFLKEKPSALPNETV